MKQRIIESISSPDQLEKLYRENKQDFCQAFAEISDNYNSDLVNYWKLRLSPETATENTAFVKSELWVILILTFITGMLVKLPDLFSQIYPEPFYQRNLAIIVFNGLILYTFWQNRFFDKIRLAIYGITLAALLFLVNYFPNVNSDSILLAFIHAPLLMWCLFGVAFIAFDFNNIKKRIEFISFNGELIIMTGLIAIAGGILTGLTIGLFSVIDMNIEEFYTKNVLVFGAVAAPIVSFYLIKLYPNITSKIAPVIAKVFTPLVLITLFVYLIVLIFSQAKILKDRELLILFNVMLLAVMAIIVFSVSELDKSKVKNTQVLILFFLAVLAIVIDVFALTAIISRLSNGFTPNRTVVLVSNILIFINLILLAKSLYESYFKRKAIDAVESTVAKYLTIYMAWTIVVIFILPFAFGYK